MCSCSDLCNASGSEPCCGRSVPPRQEQAVVIAHPGLLALLVAVLGALGGVGLTYLWSLGSPVYYGIKIDWGVPELSLRTGVAAVTVLVLAAAVYPVTMCDGWKRSRCCEALDVSLAQATSVPW